MQSVCMYLLAASQLLVRQSAQLRVQLETTVPVSISGSAIQNALRKGQKIKTAVSPLIRAAERK